MAIQSFSPGHYDELLQEHAEVGRRYAAQWAEHGPGGLLDRKAKAYICALQAEIKSKYDATNEKPLAETAAERLANADPRLGEFIAERETERMAFMLTELQLTRVNRQLDACERLGYRMGATDG